MIDIIVPTYNRPDDIKKFVSEIQKQNYNEYHVIIVDDCSTEEIESLIPTNHTNFSYVKLPENKGQAYARNVAISMGKGNIIVSLDDDAWFENPDSLFSINKTFLNYPKLGCLMFNVRSPEENYLSEVHGIEHDNELVGSHITCGCAYTRKALLDIGGFSGFLHSGAEETDVTLRLIEKKHEIRFSKEIKVFHNYTPKVRTNSWYRKLRFNTTRNDLLIVLMRYPSIKIIPYFFGKYFSHVKFSFLSKRDRIVTGLYTILALPAALLKIHIAFKHRKAVSLNDFNKWIKIRW